MCYRLHFMDVSASGITGGSAPLIGQDQLPLRATLLASPKLRLDPRLKHQNCAACTAGCPTIPYTLIFFYLPARIVFLTAFRGISLPCSTNLSQYVPEDAGWRSYPRQRERSLPIGFNPVSATQTEALITDCQQRIPQLSGLCLPILLRNTRSHFSHIS